MAGAKFLVCSPPNILRVPNFLKVNCIDTGLVEPTPSNFQGNSQLNTLVCIHTPWIDPGVSHVGLDSTDLEHHPVKTSGLGTSASSSPKNSLHGSGPMYNVVGSPNTSGLILSTCQVLSTRTSVTQVAPSLVNWWVALMAFQHMPLLSAFHLSRCEPNMTHCHWPSRLKTTPTNDDRVLVSWPLT